MPNIKNETLGAGGYIVSEANGTRSREMETLITGQNLLAGAVLGRITASGKLTAVTPAAEDGSEDAAAILYGDTDATDADARCTVTVRDAEVDLQELVWPAAASEPQKTTALGQLKALGIIAR